MRCYPKRVHPKQVRRWQGCKTGENGELHVTRIKHVMASKRFSLQIGHAVKGYMLKAGETKVAKVIGY